MLVRSMANAGLAALGEEAQRADQSPVLPTESWVRPGHPNPGRWREPVATVAETLYGMNLDEQRRLGESPRTPFVPNYTYEFANRLVYRLFDGGLGESEVCLEFLVAPGFARDKADVLAEVPRMLENAGIDAPALAALRSFLRATGS